MIKNVSTAVGMLALCAMMLLSCSNDQKKMSEELAKDCKEGGAKQFADPKIQGHFYEYCECSAAKISEKISREEFAKLKAQGHSAEMQAKIMPIVEPCLAELERKMRNTK